MVLMSQTDYAKHRGVSQQRISALVRSGKIPADCIHKRGKYKQIDRDAADAALSEGLDRIYNPAPRKKASPTKPEMEQTAKKAGTQGMSLADAQKLQAQYKAALLKLEYEQKSGKLISAEYVETETFNFARQVRDAILNIPDRISAEMASCTDVHTVNQKLTETLIEALEELSR